MSLSQEQKDNIISYLHSYQSESDLFALLGRSLGSAATGEPPEERARNTFRRRLNDIRLILCNNIHLRDFCNDPNIRDITQVAILVVEALLESGKILGLDPIILGCLISRIGLRYICDNEWKNFR